MKCYNCKTQKRDIEYTEIDGDGKYLCESCFSDMQRYEDENSDAIHDQEMYDMYDSER